MPAMLKTQGDCPKMQTNPAPRASQETIETLEWVSWGMKHFSGLAAGNRRNELEALAKSGLVKCEGLFPVCDDDGFLKDPDEYDDCYVLTDVGRELLKKDEAERDARCCGLAITRNPQQSGCEKNL